METPLVRRTAGIALAVAASLAVPAGAEAAPVPWGGAGFNDLGPATALLSVSSGRASVTRVQMILACTDAEDGTDSSRAFDASSRTRVSLRRNRYAFDFTATSGGRTGRVRVDGVLGPGRRGTVRIRVSATARSDEGAIIERCRGETRFTLRRG